MTYSISNQGVMVGVGQYYSYVGDEIQSKRDTITVKYLPYWIRYRHILGWYRKNQTSYLLQWIVCGLRTPSIAYFTRYFIYFEQQF